MRLAPPLFVSAFMLAACNGAVDDSAGFRVGLSEPHCTGAWGGSWTENLTLSCPWNAPASGCNVSVTDTSSLLWVSPSSFTIPRGQTVTTPIEIIPGGATPWSTTTVSIRERMVNIPDAEQTWTQVLFEATGSGTCESLYGEPAPGGSAAGGTGGGGPPPGEEPGYVGESVEIGAGNFDKDAQPELAIELQAVWERHGYVSDDAALPPASLADVGYDFPVGFGDADDDGILERYRGVLGYGCRLDWEEDISAGGFTVNDTWSGDDQYVTAVAVGDIDGGGWNELYVVCRSYHSSYGYGDGILRFQNSSGTGQAIVWGPYYGWFVDAIEVGDVDNDGAAERYVAIRRGSDDASWVFRSTSHSGLGSWLHGPDYSRRFEAFAIGDADDNGDNELFSAVSHDQGAEVLRSVSHLSLGPRVFGPDPDLAITDLAVGPIGWSSDDQLYGGFVRFSDDAAMILRDASGTLSGGFDEVRFIGNVW